MSKITEVTGKIVTADGKVREFSITAGIGWQQWGANTETLGDTSEALEVMTTALGEADQFASDDDQDDDVQAEPYASDMPVEGGYR